MFSNGKPFIIYLSLALVHIIYLIPFPAPHLVFFSSFTHFVLCLCFVFDLTFDPFFSFLDFLPSLSFPFLFIVKIGFPLATLKFSGNVQTVEYSSVETTRLARTEIRHDFLAHGDLLRVSLYGRQGRDSVLSPQ